VYVIELPLVDDGEYVDLKVQAAPAASDRLLAHGVPGPAPDKTYWASLLLNHVAASVIGTDELLVNDPEMAFGWDTVTPPCKKLAGAIVVSGATPLPLAPAVVENACTPAEKLIV
jgi:hypothetical protein